MNQHLRPDPVPFIDVASQRRRLGHSIDEAVARVLAHCQFINGPEVTELEKRLAEFSGAKHGRGTVSAARTGNPNSANSQFFICFDDAPWLHIRF